MQRFSRRWLRGWANVALFAMLAILASPALAFACCCGEERAPVQAPQSSSPVQKVGASHPGCHGHAEADDTPAQNAGANRATAVHSSPTISVASSMSAPCFKSICECSHAGDNVLALVEPQHASCFSPLVMGVAVQAFSSATALPSSVRFAFASNAAKPRSPDTHSRSGRAPPAFGL